MFHGFLMGAVSSTGGHYIDKYAESLGKIGEISANAVLSGTVDELGGGKFANGAITGAFAIMFNDMMHTKKKVKKAIKKELTSMIKYLIEMDGQLSLPEAYIWYKIGDGSGITVDASQINLNFVDVSSLKMNEEYGVQTWFGGLGQGLVYGGVTIQRKGANSVIIKQDKYNFEMHPWNSLGEVLRNIEAIGADFLHGRGTPFDINFRGRNFIK